MKPIVILAASILLVLMVSTGATADHQIIMEIEGMTCKLWPLAIKKSLSETEGVKNVKISFEQSKAWVIVEETVQDQVLKNAVSKTGPFRGRVIERRPIEW